MTASAMLGDREECLAAGMNDYIAKPFSPWHLCEVIERCLPQPVDQQEVTAQTSF
jgi:CheY-like chemotaxis protein